MSKVLAKVADVAALTLYGVAEAVDRVADWITHRHRDDKCGF